MRHHRILLKKFQSIGFCVIRDREKGKSGKPNLNVVEGLHHSNPRSSPKHFPLEGGVLRI